MGTAMESREGRQQSVLYIEDAPDHAFLMQQLLEQKLKVLCEVAMTSAGAEMKLNERCYDLIISDYNIPGELGDIIIERILERDPQQPVMMLTEYMTPTIREFCEKKNIPLLAKFSNSEVSTFLDRVKLFLKENYCEKRRKKPIRAVSFSSPHVAEALDLVLREKAQENEC